MHRFRLQFIAGLVLFILPVFFEICLEQSRPVAPGCRLVLFSGLPALFVLSRTLERFSALLPEVKAAPLCRFIRATGAHLEELKDIAKRAITEKEGLHPLQYGGRVVATDSGGRISFMNPWRRSF